MKTFKSLAALEAAAKRSAQVTLRNQVATLVEHKIREKAQEVVYGSYSPVMYPRRNTLGTTFALIPSGYNLRIYDISSANTPQRSGSPPGPGYFAQMINDTGAQTYSTMPIIRGCIRVSSMMLRLQTLTVPASLFLWFAPAF